MIGYHPLAWKIDYISMIPKSGKNPLQATSYRPITLLSTMGKLLERLFTRRILEFLEQEKWFKNSQSGFRANRSTSDHLFRLSESVLRAFNRQSHVVAVLLDVEKAFDSVWLDGLRYKLYMNTKIPTRLIRWVSSYLEDRKAYVRIRGFLSPAIIPTAGVPQGSVVAPILYNIFINDQPTKDSLTPQPPLLHSQFADDFAVWAASSNPHFAAYRVQTELAKHEIYCNNWRIKLNPSKTQVILFTRSGRTTKLRKRPHSDQWESQRHTRRPTSFCRINSQTSRGYF